MKSRSLLLALAFAALTLPAGNAAAVVLHTEPVGIDIPDDSATGLASLASISLTDVVVGSLSVHLTITPASGQTAFLGDLYAHLEHNGTIAILLNRPGRNLQNLAGYDDDQPLNVTFTDGAPDIHTYRPIPSVALTGPLTGTYGPDARSTDPALTLATDPRTRFLGGFVGANPDGDWTLFVADLSGGGVHRLTSWTLQFNTVAIPEPHVWLTGILLIAWTLHHRLGSGCSHNRS